jgi:SNF family Na+-dependent transporter
MDRGAVKRRRKLSSSGVAFLMVIALIVLLVGLPLVVGPFLIGHGTIGPNAAKTTPAPASP